MAPTPQTKKGHAPDYIFLSAIIILVIFGLVMLSSASSDLGKIHFNDTFYYLKHQIFYGLSLGIAGFLAAAFIYYKKWQSASFVLLLLSIFGLIMVFTPLGIHAGGATRWINLGPFSVQPAEILKITFMVYLAAWLSNKKSKRSSSFTEGLLPLLIISAIVAGLVIIQPATTTVVIILGASLVMYFMSGAKMRYIAAMIAAGILILALLVVATPYRMNRVMGYLSGSKADIQGSGYHLNQALISIGSGGLWGVGYGQSTAKYKFLPEPIGDSIFAVTAEELGFAGSIFVISIFALIIIRGIIIAKKSRDDFGRLAATGLISIIGIQTFINLGAISGILPLTGVPLPFVSYGGTALAIFLTMAGIIVNISKYT